MRFRHLQSGWKRLNSYTATIRLPEPVNSVIVGDPNLFQAEHSPNEPLLVFARAVTSGPGESNLVISTTRGRQFIFLLRSIASSAEESEAAVDLLVTCRPAGSFFIEETFSAAVVPETLHLESAAAPGAGETAGNDLARTLDEMVTRQRKQKIERLYGDGIRAGIGQVAEQGSLLIVAFSVMNSQAEAVELVPPQVQLAGQTKAGVFRRPRWTTVQQLPLQTYQITDRRLDPGERVDGVVVFERPSIKQSTESLLLQIADYAAVDQPTLAPISFRQTQPQEKRP